MKEENIKINSNKDKLPISITIFIPEAEIKGIFQISHGMAEHKERYYDFMKYLTKNGYVTVINDHRGHGKSIKNNNDLGYFYDNTSDYIVDDLHQITLYIKERYPDKKVVLFGHSMGSMVVRKYLKKYDKDIDKLIVCGSPSKNPFSKVALKISKVVKNTKGEKYRSNLIQNLAFGNYNKKLKETTSENAWICANPETIKKYDEDNLCGFVFTANGFENLFKLMEDIYTKKGWKLENKKIPILFIAGADDPVIISKDKWLESQEFLKQIGYVNIEGKLYDGLRHEILNEKNNEEIYKDILSFLNKE